MNTKTIAFVRNESFSDITALALLTVTTDIETSDKVIAAIITSLTEWVETSELGKQAYFGSGEDFNVGDYLCLSDNELKEIEPILKHNGIVAINPCDNVDHVIGYDKLLVETEIEEGF